MVVQKQSVADTHVVLDGVIGKTMRHLHVRQSRFVHRMVLKQKQLNVKLDLLVHKHVQEHVLLMDQNTVIGLIGIHQDVHNRFVRQMTQMLKQHHVQQDIVAHNLELDIVRQTVQVTVHGQHGILQAV